MHYEFLVMPFGMTNFSSVFMDYMNHIVQPYLNRFVVIFIDDILIYSKNPQKACRSFEGSVRNFARKKAYTKFTKCELMLT